MAPNIIGPVSRSVEEPGLTERPGAWHDRCMTTRATQVHRAVLVAAFALAGSVALPVAAAHPSEPGVVSYAVLGKGSVGNIVGGPMGWESVFTQPVQGDWVDLPECNNWADIGQIGRAHV